MFAAAGVLATLGALRWDVSRGANPVPVPRFTYTAVNNYYVWALPTQYYPVGAHPSLAGTEGNTYANGTTNVAPGANDAFQRVGIRETHRLVENEWLRGVRGVPGDAGLMWAVDDASPWMMRETATYRGETSEALRLAGLVHAGFVGLAVVQFVGLACTAAGEALFGHGGGDGGVGGGGGGGGGRGGAGGAEEGGRAAARGSVRGERRRPAAAEGGDKC